MSRSVTKCAWLQLIGMVDHMGNFPQGTSGKTESREVTMSEEETVETEQEEEDSEEKRRRKR